MAVSFAMKWSQNPNVNGSQAASRAASVLLQHTAAAEALLVTCRAEGAASAAALAGANATTCAAVSRSTELAAALESQVNHSSPPITASVPADKVHTFDCYQVPRLLFH